MSGQPSDQSNKLSKEDYLQIANNAMLISIQKMQYIK